MRKGVRAGPMRSGGACVPPPLPREWGREGQGVACPLSVCARWREKGKPGVTCPCVPPFHANGVLRKGGDGSMPSCAPFRATPLAWKGEKGGVGRPGGGGHCVPLICNWGGEGKEGKRGGWVVLDPVAEAQRACHVHRRGRHTWATQRPLLLIPVAHPSPLPFPFASNNARGQGYIRLRGTQCLPPPGLPGPPFSPFHANGVVRKGAHKGMPPSLPFRSTPFVWKGGAQGHVTPGFPFSHHLAHMERGHMTPCPSLPHLHGRGGDRGCARANRPTSPCQPRSCPFPLVHAAPFAQNEGVRRQDMQKGDMQGAPAPFPHPVRAERVHVTPSPFPLGRATPHTRGT
ncbi:hypothetical protein EDB83DRAFT_2311990 [Lactarius deliciosus]|nr:hypothetical protein EDB83DRAFT_2311990 [Lactarius deliciosus]